MSPSTPLQIIPYVHRATHSIGLHLAGLKALNVTQAEAHVLDHLVVVGDCTVGELHRAFAHRRSTLTSVLDRAEARRLVTRESSPDDRRTFNIRLTAEGKTLAARVHAELQQIEATVLANVSKRDLKGLRQVLAALDDALARGQDSPE